MSFPTNGVYIIKNIGRDLMLDLKDNNTAEGTPIQGSARNGTVAQQVSTRIRTRFSLTSRILVGDQETKTARIVLQQVC
jgi:hypothetical protein